MRKSFKATVAPRCQHTCNAVLLRVFVIGDLFGVDVATADDIGVGDAAFRPHDSRPSSDEPVRQEHIENMYNLNSELCSMHDKNLLQFFNEPIGN